MQTYGKEQEADQERNEVWLSDGEWKMLAEICQAALYSTAMLSPEQHRLCHQLIEAAG